MIRIGRPQVASVAESAYPKARVSVDDETARRYIAKTAVLKNFAWQTSVDYPPAAGRIRLLGPVSDAVLPCAGAVGTGMSSGVDSFYTVMTHGANTPRPLTHLTYYTAFSLVPFGSTDVVKTFDAIDKIFDEEVRHASEVTSALGLTFVPVRTNLDRDFCRGGMIYSGMYRSLASTLALGKLLGTYYSSSSGHGRDLGVRIIAQTQNYEHLICDSCQTETLTYINSDDVLRTEKLRLLADNPLFRRHMSVCYHLCACGECLGCWKTMFPLDILGKLDLFGDVFDLPRYYARREELLRSFVSYAMKPGQESLKVTLEQLVRLAESESGDSAVRFRELLRTAMMA